jgi:hypothetical protein
MKNNFEAYEKRREDDHTQDEREYECECNNCGQASTHVFCSKECYLIAKADYEMDQDR